MIRIPDCSSDILTIAGPYEVPTGTYRRRVVFQPGLSERVCAELIYAPPSTSDVPPDTVQVEVMVVPSTEPPDSVRVDVVLVSED